MTRGTLRDAWRREVFRSPHVGDACKLLLIAMADDMAENGYVTVPRSTLARRLGRVDRRISERLAEAVEARLLDRVQRGQKGQTATYRAILRVPGCSTLTDPPSIFQDDDPEHPEVSPDPHPESGFRVTPGGPAFSKWAGTEGDRAASEMGTTQLRNDEKTHDVLSSSRVLS